MSQAGAARRANGTAWPTMLAARVAAFAGWRRYGCAAALGVLAVAAMPPWHFIVVLPVAFAGLVWLIDGCGAGHRGARIAFLVGWCFGLGHFAVGLYWVVNAPLVYGFDTVAMLPLVPIISIGLPALLGLFPAVACLVAWWLAGRLLAPGAAARVLLLAACWTGFEWLRGNVLTGFPWLLAGYVWTGSDAMLQLTAHVGIYGLSLLTVAAAAMPAALAGGPAALESPRRRWLWLAAAAAALTLTWASGAWRLAQAGPSDALATAPDVMLRVVQPNIRQQDKWARARQVPNFMLHLRLTAAPGPETITHTVWPETATPFFLAERGDARRLMARAIARGGAVIAGAPRRSSPGRLVRLWNSLFVIDDTGAVAASYDKAHLVPFGEYVPLGRYLPLVKLVQGQIDYAPGPGRRTLRVPGLPPFSPLICYEAIFPGAVLDRSDRPAWLLNITNDAWFGTSAGPYQHLAIARTRAVEEGMALVRAANTGISVVIDPYGRVMARLGIGERGVIDSALPSPLEGATLFGRFGDWLTAFMIAAALVVALLLGRRVGT